MNDTNTSPPSLGSFLRRFVWTLVVVAGFGLLPAVPVFGQGVPGTTRSEPTGTPTVSDEPVRLTGELYFTLPDFFTAYPEPYVSLINISEYVDPPRLDDYADPRESQVLGQITSDYVSPLAYALELPVEPLGPSADVDNDRVRDVGVQIYTVELMSNVVGDPYLNLGWGDSLSDYGSALWGSDGSTVIGGKVLVYAPDDAQEFPSGSGADGLVFTADDPVTPLPQGYSVIDLDTEPFTIERTRAPQVDLLEPPDIALNDFSEIDYAQAFDALIDLLALEYAFTDYYGLDWEALRTRYAARVAQANKAGDYDAFVEVLYELVGAIPDGHVSLSVEELPESLLDGVSGSLGLVLQELDDGRVFVTESIAGLPAARAGIETGAEIFAIDEVPIMQAISDTIPFSESGLPAGHYRRLQQMLYVERGPVDSAASATYRNPNASRRTTVDLTRVENWDVLYWPRFYEPELSAVPLPLEFDLLDSGYGYIQLNNFWDDPVLTIDLWERAIDILIFNEIDGLVLDMRYNDGGYIWLAELLASYLLQNPIDVGNVAYYIPELEEFTFDPFSHTIEPMPESWRYNGSIALLIGPDCASACEFFSYALAQDEAVEIMGYYPSLGMGGFVESVALPDNIVFYMTTGRAVDATGEIHIEGVGVSPNVRTPVTKENVFSDYDVLVANAELHLKLHSLR